MYFVSAGCGLSQTHHEIMEDLLELVSQTVSPGCGALQLDNHSHLKEMQAQLQGFYPFFSSLPVSYQFLLPSGQKICPERTRMN